MDGWMDGPWIHTDVAISTTSEARIHAGAKGRPALLAVAAPAVGHVEGHHDAVSLLEQGHAVARFLHDAHVLVAEGDAGLGTRAAFVLVDQAGSALLMSRPSRVDMGAHHV